MKNKENLVWIIPVSIIGLILVALLSVVLVPRIDHMIYLDRRPDAQADTTWVSEDGKIRIRTEDLNCKIYFELEDSVKEFYFSTGGFYTAHVHYPDKVNLSTLEESKTRPTVEVYEEWEVTKHKRDSFTVVVQKTTFLEVGQAITFHKLKDKN